MILKIRNFPLIGILEYLDTSNNIALDLIRLSFTILLDPHRYTEFAKQSENLTG
ncbi:hypothetical protein MSP8887_01312 [Marinomonas spartinae]|nr:hypothetical protein MSP8887_01312 [Marinomonas spartinae]